MHTKFNNIIIYKYHSWLVSKPHIWNHCDCYEFRKLGSISSGTFYNHYPAQEIIDLFKKYEWAVVKIGKTICSVCNPLTPHFLDI